MLQNRRPVIYGDGLQSRDFTYVQNVVEANLLACTAPDVAGEVFNIACGDRITVNEMLMEINKIAGKDITPVYEAERPADIKHSQAAIEKAEKRLNYKPGITFVDGLRRTVEWYAANLATVGR